MKSQAALYPLFAQTRIIPTSPKLLIFSECPKRRAVQMVKLWHSRLPYAQKGPWMYAFAATYHDNIFAVALVNNCSARMLPDEWIELRRLAVAPDAPKYTASWFLSKMVKWFRQNTNHERIISYQDTAVHEGTIYKAANWEVGNVSTPRQRDRTKLRANTSRLYRTNTNGLGIDVTKKVRWEYQIK